MVIAQDPEKFQELWDLFDHRKSPYGHWPELKRYFDNELEAFLETLNEESEQATIINHIFHAYLKNVQSGEVRPVLGQKRKPKGYLKNGSKLMFKCKL